MFSQRPEKKSKQSGFTLIELAIIMAIIGILGAVGAVKFASMKTEAETAAQLSALANIRSALAIATVKDVDGTIELADLDGYLEGVLSAGSDTGCTWTDGASKFTVVYASETVSSKISITSITSVTKTK